MQKSKQKLNNWKSDGTREHGNKRKCLVGPENWHKDGDMREKDGIQG
jgi:hypothetical protein